MNRLNKMLERRREDAGFTLIELMVVVLIIGILIAIAIPTFLGARTRAQDRAAQSNLRNTVTNAKAVFTDNETFDDATIAELTDAEPSVTYQTAAITTATAGVPDVVSVEDDAADGGATHDKVFYAAAISESGTCWYVRQSEDNDPPALAADQGAGGLRWAKDEDPAAAACDAATALASFASFTSKTPGGADEITP